MKVVKYLAYLIITIALITTAYLYSPPLDDIVVTFLPTTDQTKVQRITLNNDQPSSLLVEGSLNHTCTKKHNNFVFVKTHKTGTSTTVNILYHFGITHGLNYAVYPYSHQLYLVQPARLMKLLSNETYSIMCQHMVFDKSAIESVMPSNSYYFSLIRNPIKAFVSFFIFYNNDQRMIHYAGSKISLDESINRFLNLKIRESNVKEDSGSYLIANNFNSMSYDLGMSHGRTKLITEDDITAYIRMLDDRFDLLMTLEHLDESLLLLQQDLCWDMDEMFYLNRMVSKSQRSHEPLEESTVARLTKLLTPDVRLYKHFSEKLDKRLSGMSPDFADKLKEFREAKSKFESDCMVMDKLVAAPYHSQQHPLTEEGEASLHCQVLAERDTTLTKLISRLQDPNYASQSNSDPYVNKYGNLGSFPRQWKLKT